MSLVIHRNGFPTISRDNFLTPFEKMFDDMFDHMFTRINELPEIIQIEVTGAREKEQKKNFLHLWKVIGVL